MEIPTPILAVPTRPHEPEPGPDPVPTRPHEPEPGPDPDQTRPHEPEPEPAQLHTIQCIEEETGMTWGDPALTSLTELSLWNNQITDLAPLSARPVPMGRAGLVEDIAPASRSLCRSQVATFAN
eukprot:SAG22_NODE_2229_length_2812_cov_4.603022_1_plen_124_part_00